KRWAWWTLIGVSILQYTVVFSDFRFRLNQHYMLAWLLLAFVWVPDRRRLARYLFVGFYFVAGTLKLNPDWLSGRALPYPTFLGQGWVLQCAMAYAVIFELLLIWGLLAKNRWVFWIAYGHLVVFSLFSMTQVGFFYPLLMLATSSVLVLDRAYPREAKRTLTPTVLVLATFAGFQFVPYIFPGDSALTGEGRLFALHMFDARVECRSVAEVQRDGQTLGFFDLKGELPGRTRCDPAMVLARARALCHGAASKDVSFNVRLESRRASSSELQPIVTIDDFCTHIPEYSLFSHNEWISVPKHRTQSKKMPGSRQVEIDKPSKQPSGFVD
ncbi:MAG: hypothetical protein AAFQ82_04895, partial [Myxococcota bacterium]